MQWKKRWRVKAPFARRAARCTFFSKCLSSSGGALGAGAGGSGIAQKCVQVKAKAQNGAGKALLANQPGVPSMPAFIVPAL